MFASFRRHQKWIWILAMIVVIPSFVIFFTDTSHLTGAGTSRNIPGAMVNGQPVLRKDLIEAQREAMILYRFNAGRWPDGESAELENFAYQYVAQIGKTRDAQITVSEEMAIQRIKSLFRDENGAYNPELYKRFVGELAEHHLNEDDLFRYFKHELAFSQLRAVYGLGGRLVTSRSLEPAFRHDQERAVVDVVFLYASNYVSKVVVNPAELTQFYSNRAANYFLPARVRLAYVEYPASNYFKLADEAIAKIPQLDNQVENFYQESMRQRGTNAFVGEDGKPLTPEAARQKIKDDQRKQMALMEARKEAIKLAAKAVEKEPARVENLIAAAEGMKLTVKTTEPFNEETGPKGLKLPPALIDLAFRLTPDEAIQPSPVIGEDAVYVVALREKLPSQAQTLDQAREKVTQDYKEFQAQLLLRTAGSTLHTNLNKSLATGKPFKDAAVENKVTAKELPSFARSDRFIKGEEDLQGFNRLRDDAFNVKPGKLSNFAFMGDRGYILHVREHRPVSEDVLKAELPKFVDQLRDRNVNIAFSDWFNKHVQIARPEPPKKESQP